MWKESNLGVSWGVNKKNMVFIGWLVILGVF